MLINNHQVYIRRGFKPQKNWAVFFDRDGVINLEKGFVYQLKDLELIPKTIIAIQRLNAARIPVIVVHNAAAVARNLCPISAVERFNQYLIDKLKKKNASIDALFYCPHHFNAYNLNFKKDCDWRKPKPGMLLAASNQFKLDLTNSFLIGDHVRDIEAGNLVGVKTFLVKNGQEILSAVDQILL